MHPGHLRGGLGGFWRGEGEGGGQGRRIELGGRFGEGRRRAWEVLELEVIF